MFKINNDNNLLVRGGTKDELKLFWWLFVGDLPDNEHIATTYFPVEGDTSDVPYGEKLDGDTGKTALVVHNPPTKEQMFEHGVARLREVLDIEEILGDDSKDRDEQAASEFRVGDAVYCNGFGHGEVIAIAEQIDRPVIVLFVGKDDDEQIWAFTRGGATYGDESGPQMYKMDQKQVKKTQALLDGVEPKGE